MRMPTLSDAAEAFSLSSAVQQRLTGNFLSEPPTGQLVELPGDAPFSLCPVSRSTDLFEIKYVELTKQPVYMCVTPLRRCNALLCNFQLTRYQ